MAIHGEAMLLKDAVDGPQADGLIPQEHQFASNRGGADGGIALLREPLTKQQDSLLHLPPDWTRRMLGAAGPVGQARGPFVLKPAPPLVEPIARASQDSTNGTGWFSSQPPTDGFDALIDLIVHPYTLLMTH